MFCYICERSTVYSVNLLECQTPIRNLSVNKIQNFLSKKTKQIVIDLSFMQQNYYNCGRLFVSVQGNLMKFHYFIICKCNYVAVFCSVNIFRFTDLNPGTL